MKFSLTIPENKSEIKLKHYQKYSKIVAENEDNANFLNIKAVEIFCNVKIKDVRSINVNDFNDTLTLISKALDTKDVFKNKFTYKGVEYGFIPKLDDMSLGEYVDAESYLSDMETMHKAMAVLFRPITFSKDDLYLIEEYETSEKYSDIMKEMPLDVALGAQVFFYNLGNVLLKHTIAFLEEEGMQHSQVRQILLENGGGIKAFMQLLEGNSMSLQMSLN